MYTLQLVYTLEPVHITQCLWAHTLWDKSVISTLRNIPIAYKRESLVPVFHLFDKTIPG